MSLDPRSWAKPSWAEMCKTSNLQRNEKWGLEARLAFGLKTPKRKTGGGGGGGRRVAESWNPVS